MDYRKIISGLLAYPKSPISFFTDTALPLAPRVSQLVERLNAIGGATHGMRFGLIVWRKPDPLEIPLGVELLCWRRDWEDPLRNPSGVKVCMLQDNGFWVTAKWNAIASRYESQTTGTPEMWAEKPPMPEPIPQK